MVQPSRVLWNSLKSVVVAVFAAACVASCASGADGDLDTALEAPASASHGLTETRCGLRDTCACYASDECTEYTCGTSVQGCCTARVVGRAGEPCAKEAGRCVPVNAPILRQAVLECCTGCAAPTSDRTVFVCAPGDQDPRACGTAGAACQNCNDGNPCTNDTCERGVCVNQPVGDGAACGGGRCIGGECCTGCVQGGRCVANGNLPETCGLGGAACKDCVDTNPCTNDACVQGGCDNSSRPNGASCETDGDVCNGKSVCQGGSCADGAPLDCDDDNPCTDDACDPAGGCTRTNNTAVCSDEDPCTTGDRCSGGECMPGTAVTCDDNNVCTMNVCNPQTGACTNPPTNNGGMCDDRNACTPSSQCAQGQCVSNTPSPCSNDANPCTQNGCQVVQGQQLCIAPPPNEPNGTACIHADKCRLNTTCTAGACGGGVAKDCNDNNPCTTDGCNAQTGACTNTPVTGGDCSDGSACTLNDTCANGECVGEAVECAALDDCHAPGSCDETTGLCDDPRKADGEPCLADTGLCEGGTCIVPPPSEGGAGGEGGAGSVPEAGATSTGGNGAVGGGVGAAGDDGVDPGRGDVFERTPGGCDCRVPASSAPRSGLALGLALAGLGLLFRRRERRARLRA